RIVLDPLVAERRPGQIDRRADGAAVEKDDVDLTTLATWGAVASLLHARHLPANPLGQRRRKPAADPIRGERVAFDCYACTVPAARAGTAAEAAGIGG